ncbi:helix-turn-helix domain-containing protein [Olivibacter jilunii]|uniref:helix-turn-helix domain-containing protein n=1 Tax=Olivibacter jilunii TaxID=985016 RepID=UPI001030FB8A|nr:helix-turn-helix domain-containing protein [Olivibacter jilunii]
MSSNIKVKKICEYCGNEFEARTTVTRYCSHVCNRRAYKALQRGKKVEVAVAQTAIVRNKPLLDVKEKAVLSVKEAALLMGLRRQVINEMINSGRLPATNFGVRKTRIKREDLDALFSGPDDFVPLAQLVKKENTDRPLERDECYTIVEVLDKYDVSPSTLQKMITANNVRKQKDGRNILVPKAVIDSLLDGFEQGENTYPREIRPLDPVACYTIGEAEKLLGLSPSAVYYGIMRRGIQKQLVGNHTYVLRSDIDKWASELNERIAPDERYSIDEIAKILGRSRTAVEKILKDHAIEKIKEKNRVYVLKRDVEHLQTKL